MDPQILETYVGKYEVESNFIISVTRDGEKLFVQATGQPEVQLFAETELMFFLKVVDAQIIFKKDDQGKVTQLILNQGGTNMPAKKIE